MRRRLDWWMVGAAALAACLCACRDNGKPSAVATSPTQADATLSRAQASAARPTPWAPPLRAVPGEFLVKFRAPVSAAYAANVMATAAFHLKHSYLSVPGLQRAVASPGVDTRAMAAVLAAQPGVEYVEPNFIVHAMAVPNDPAFSFQWPLHNVGQNGGSSTANPDIGALAAWDITTGSSQVVVAVIDTGVDYRHPDLAANIFANQTECSGNGLDNDGNGYTNDCHGINAITGSGDPMDDYFHGTHVAGIIGAKGNNGIGISGVNWDVTLLPCKFLDSSGSGSTADAITCLDYIAGMKDRGVNVVASNNSWGAGGYSQALADAIVAQRSRGILFVAAAGNNSSDNDRSPVYPCNYDLSNIICVASAYNAISRFSDFGLGTVHVAAPGDNIYSTVPNNAYDVFDGTSMATPHVSGAVALLAAQDPNRDWRAIKNLVLAGAIPPTEFRIPTITGGRLYLPGSLACTNSVVQARLRPANFEPISLAVSGTLRLEGLNINCAVPNGSMSVTVQPGGQVVTLRDNGTGPDEVANDGIYAASWTATQAGIFTITFPGRAGDVVDVVVDAMLKRGFPLRTENVADLDGYTRPPVVSLIVGNLDADLSLEILSPGYDIGPLYAWKANGSVMPGWPNYDVTATAQVSIGKFSTQAPGMGVVAGFWLNGLHLYNADATPVAGWPQTTSNLWFPAPAADMDGDGIDEIIGYPARRTTGTPFVASLMFPSGNYNNPGWFSTPAIADLDADGMLDVVVVDATQLYASNALGLLPGFPVPLPPILNSTVTSYPVIGDIDGDGAPNIIVPLSNWTGSAGYLTLYIYDNRGRQLRSMATTEPDTNDIPSLADLDGDGVPEIVVASGTTVYAWKGDGTAMTGWPVSIGAGKLIGPVAVGDIDGDGQPDLALQSAGYLTVTPQPNQLHAYNRSGQKLAGFPKTENSVVWPSMPVIADLDHVGRNVLLVSHNADQGLRDNIFAYDLQGAGPYGPVEWGQYMGGADHRGYYPLGKNLIASAWLSAQAHGAGAIRSADAFINCGNTCAHRYTKGTSVTLTATAAAGGSFSQWLGPCAGHANPCTIPVNQYTPVAADFASPVAVTASPGGSVKAGSGALNCPTGPCTVQYPARTTLTLSAAAVAGYAFKGWSGDCSGLQSDCNLVIDGAKAATATFTNHWNLTLAKSGSGNVSIVSNPAGVNCGAVCTGSFPPGTTVLLTATPDDNSYIQDWGLPGCLNYQNQCTLTLTADITAAFKQSLKPTVTLTMNAGGNVTVEGIDPTKPAYTCTATCTVSAPPGSVVTLTPRPQRLYQFAGWTGDCGTTSGTCQLLMDSSKGTQAIFEAQPQAQLSLTISGAGAGTVGSPDGAVGCSASCTTMVAANSLVTLSVMASAGSQFDGWTGVCSGTASTCSFSIATNTSVGASFSKVQSTGGGGSGALTPGWLALLVAAIAMRRRSRLACRRTLCG